MAGGGELSKPRILLLCCKAGGDAMGYYRAGFEVVGVDIQPQPNFPFEFIRADARDYWDNIIANERIWEYSAVHASPPCQRWSTQTQNHWNKHPDLLEPIQRRLRKGPLHYVIENVAGAPLLNPVRICGSAFGLGVRRHRFFESDLPLFGTSCNHASQPPRYRVYDHGKWYLARTVPVYGTGGGKAKEHWSNAMGINWMTHAEMAEAIPPVYAQFLGEQLLEHLRVAA